MSITRWDPWRDLSQMRAAMDRLMEDSFSNRSSVGWEGVAPTDVVATDNELLVKMALPGVRPDDVEITITGDAITVRGETKKEKEEKEERYFHREIQVGRFGRTIALPFPVESERAVATFDNGVLTVRLPKSEAIKPKKIAIGGANRAEVKSGDAGKVQ